MSTELDTSIENIENTFLPRARNKKFSINGLVALILNGFCTIDDLPPQVKKPVLEVMQNKTL